MMDRKKSFLPLSLSILTLLMTLPLNAQDEQFGVPQDSLDIPLSSTIELLLDDDLLTDEERNDLAAFHGVWDELQDPTPSQQAMVALVKYDLNNSVFNDESVKPIIAAEAALKRGEPRKAVQLLGDDVTAQGSVVRGLALERIGELDKAVAVLRPWREKVQFGSFEDPKELTAATEGMLILARLEGRPSQDYQTASKMFARVRDEMGRIHWPAHLGEARLLIDRHNRKDGAAALMQTLRLNPKCGEAWFLLGKMSVETFDFDRAEAVIEKLRAINSDHPLADMLETYSLLRQRDTANALKIINKAVERYPRQRELLAWQAAATAMTFDKDALQKVLARADEFYPGDPLPYYITGETLSFFRQYKDGEQMLREAIDRQPNWPEPHVELGLLLMQAGDDKAALTELNRAVELDPFHIGALNQRKLVEQLVGYERIETEHFTVKYKQGIDAVLARDMAFHLETIYKDITTTFEHEPDRRTTIDIMPDSQWFAVRITGMPEIWTIAAATGDVISLTPPRTGPKQRGLYFWYNVIQHEYVHTVTLSQTANRIPHWFTEGAAVSQELIARDYDTCQLLANAVKKDELFRFDEINWAFIRPTKETDRPQAYAQANWMLEYVAETYGHDKIVAMLRLFKEGVTDVDAIEQVTGEKADVFFESFKSWAAAQVELWGLGNVEKIAALGEDGGASGLSDGQLKELLAEHPNHPEILNVIAERAVKGEDAEVARQAVLQYSAARPVDPWSYRQLVLVSDKTGNPEEVITSLERLDSVESSHGAFAYRLAQLQRQGGKLDAASTSIWRALLRDPYNGTYRELAATIELQRGKMEDAIHHLTAMPILEPDRAIHQVRLAALYHKLGRTELATAAANAALEIDPDAPVQKFLGE